MSVPPLPVNGELNGPKLMRKKNKVKNKLNEEKDKEKQTTSLAHEKLRLSNTMCLFFILVFSFNHCKSVICYIRPSRSPAGHNDLLLET